MEVVDKLVGEENSRVVLGRNLRGWGRRRVRVFRARGVVVGWVGRVWRGGGSGLGEPRVEKRTRASEIIMIH